MKKSFLKRAMAAAVAVPVALTQTVMFASFAAGEDTGSGTKVIDMTTFTGIPADATIIDENVAESYTAKEAELPYAIAQENNWNSDLRAALTEMYDEQVTLDPAKLADSVNSTAWYSEFLKAALRAEGTTVTAKVRSDDVVITIDVNYNYGQDAANRMVKGLGDEYKAAVANLDSKAVIDGSITITADVEDLDEVKSIPFDVDMEFAGMKEGKITDTVIPYIQGIYDTVKAEVLAAVDEAGLDPAALDHEWKRCQGKINTAQRAINRAGESRSADFEAADTEELYAKAREKAIGQSPRFKKLPESIAAAQNTNAYAAAYDIFEQAVEKINQKAAEKNGCEYQVVMTLDDVVDTVNSLTDITAFAAAADFNYAGSVAGYLPDDDFDASAYMEYFTEKVAEENVELAKNNQKKVLVSVESVKYANVAAMELTDEMNGAVGLDVYRIVYPTYEITDIEETSESDTTEATDATDETKATDATEATDTTEETNATDATDATDATEPTDATDTTDATDATEPTEGPTEEPTGETDVPARHDVKVEVEGGFFFSHDPRAFDTMNLIKSATIEENGTERAINAKEMENFSFSFRRNRTIEEAEPSGEAVSPQSAYADKSLNATSSYFGQTLYVYYEGELVANAEATVFIGVKGDVNNDGVCNASDAARILAYAAQIGAGQDVMLYPGENETLEQLAYFLGDTNGESTDHGKTASYDASIASPVNASDAAQVLIYSAAVGASDNGKANWIPQAIKNAPFPKYSEEIYNYMVQNGMIEQE